MASTILIADDSITIRKAVALCLSGQDYLVKGAENGEIAFSMVKDLKPDIVLADINMPGKDGLQLCKEIKEDLNLKHIPVVILYSQQNPIDENQISSVNADALIAKPFESHLLIDTLKQFIQPSVKPEEKESLAAVGKPYEEEYLKEIVEEMELPEDAEVDKSMESFENQEAELPSPEEAGFKESSEERSIEEPPTEMVSDLAMDRVFPSESLEMEKPPTGELSFPLAPAAEPEEPEPQISEAQAPEITPPPSEDATPIDDTQEAAPEKPVEAIEFKWPDEKEVEIETQLEQPKEPEPEDETLVEVPEEVSDIEFFESLAASAMKAETDGSKIEEPKFEEPLLEEQFVPVEETMAPETPLEPETIVEPVEIEPKVKEEPEMEVALSPEEEPIETVPEIGREPKEELVMAEVEPEPGAAEPQEVKKVEVPEQETQMTQPKVENLELRDDIERIAREIIEKVAWEVIPDLAERLITEEIKRISEEQE